MAGGGGKTGIEILREGYRNGGRKKTEAIKTVRGLYAGLPGYDVSRFARSQDWLDGKPGGRQKDDRRPWTREGEQELFGLAGYEPEKVIAESVKQSAVPVSVRI